MTDVIQALDLTAKPPDDPAALRRAYLATLQGKRLLLVLDNAANVGQVRDLLSGPPTMGIIVTSRVRLSLPGAVEVTLDAMPDDDALELLRRILPDADGAALGDLAAACGGLPLALRVAGGYLRATGRGIEGYLNQLRAARLERFGKDARALGDKSLDVRTVLELSVTQLAADDAELAAQWQALGVFPAGFDVAAAAAVLGVEAEDAEEALGLLYMRSLVGRDADVGRYRLHDLLRDVAITNIDNILIFDLKQKHAMHFANLICFANYVYDNVDEIKGLLIFDLDRKNIEIGREYAKTYMAEDNKLGEILWLYPLRGANVVDVRLTRQQEYEWLKDGYAAVWDVKNFLTMADCASNLASVAVRMDRNEEAYHLFREALSYYEKIRDISKIISTRYNYATFFKNIGCLDFAREEAKKSEIMLYNNFDNLSSKFVVNCRVLHCMIFSSYHDENEEFSEAINYLHLALNISTTNDLGLRKHGILFGNLSMSYGKSSLFNRAKRYAKKQLTIGEAIGDPLCVADSLQLLARSNATLGNFKDAITDAEQANSIYKNYGYIDHEKTDELLEQIKADFTVRR